MILLDREDVVRLDLLKSPFYVRWDPDDPVAFAEGQALDFPEIMADGPFLLVVHDEGAWAGQPERLVNVAGRELNFQNWTALADLYAESMGISRLSMLRRYTSIRRQTRRRPVGLGWMRWENAYHWPDGDDLAWSALVHGRHPILEVREHDGKRQVRSK